MEEKNLNFDEIIDRRNTDCLKFDFAVRRGKPCDVLPLWVADMDFKTSSLILDEINKRTEHGIFGYTESRDEYFEALSSWFLKHHDMEVKREWLVKTPGVVFALAMAVKAYTRCGDAVLIQQPVYYPFSEVIKDNRRRIVSNDLNLGEDNKYHIDFEDFEKKIRENEVKLFLFCSPHNPTGRVWTKEELQEMGRILLKYKVIVVSDEIHEDFTFKGYKHTPLINACPFLEDLLITATSPAKTFNLAGLQISNIFIPNQNLRHAFRKQVAAAGYSQLNTFGIVACEAAYKYGETWYEALKEYLEKNLSFVRDFLKYEVPEVRLVDPEGTYLLWLNFKHLHLSQKDLEDRIVNKAKLWLDSGDIFGPTGRGFERLNIATQRSVLGEALNRLKNAVS